MAIHLIIVLLKIFFFPPRHFPSSSQPFSHVQAQQRLRSDPSAGCYGHQLVANQPGHTAAPRQKELCDGRPKRRWEVKIISATASLNSASALWSANHHTNTLIKRTSPCQPLWQGGEVGEHISCHHVQTGLRELQVDSLQPLVCLGHCVLISGAQTAGGGWGVHPTGGKRREG